MFNSAGIGKLHTKSEVYHVGKSKCTEGQFHGRCLREPMCLCVDAN